MATEIYPHFTLITDIGATANSYSTAEDARSVWSTDMYKDISTNSNRQIAQALITSTRNIDQYLGSAVLGDLADDANALLFPRINLCDARGVEITSTTTYPPEIVLATQMQAWFYLQENREAEAATDFDGVEEIKMDGLGSKKYSTSNRVKKTLIHDETARIISHFRGANFKYSSSMGKG